MELKKVLIIYLWMSLFFTGNIFASSSLEDRPTALDFSSDWNLTDDAADIKIYRHPWPGDEIGTFKVVAMIDAPPQSLVHLMMNLEDYHQWVPNITHATLLQKHSSSEVIYTLGMASPWPLANRDWVNIMRVIQLQSSQIQIQFEALNHFYPEQDGFIRVKKNFGSWTLIPQEKNRTKLIWMWYTDPAGAIPNWLIKWGAKQQVMESITNIRKKLQSQINTGEEK